ncbi:transposase [Pseudonocardia sp. CA-142604]|uniref:transposase n=1 Tax=Pseudonocardia sp. CA-142604 TaxID=3240024 RepID=UPI003D90A8D6
MTHWVYQQIITAYAHPDPRQGRPLLAYFTHRASNGPTEAITGRLEALRRCALGSRNLINYRIRSSLLHAEPSHSKPEEPV